MKKSMHMIQIDLNTWGRLLNIVNGLKDDNPEELLLEVARSLFPKGHEDHEDLTQDSE